MDNDKLVEGGKEEPQGLSFMGVRMGVDISDSNSVMMNIITSEHITKLIEAAAEDERAKNSLNRLGRYCPDSTK